MDRDGRRNACVLKPSGLCSWRVFLMEKTMVRQKYKIVDNDVSLL